MSRASVPTAHAQATSVEIRQYQPTPFSDGYLRLDGTATLPRWRLHAGFDLDYGWKSLVLIDVAPSIQRSRKTTYDFIGHAVGGDLTLAMGLAGSMGQFLLCAGTAGKRFSLPHAQVLMHQGSAGFGGTAADIEIYAGQLERTGRTVNGLTAQHTGQPVERIEADGLRDRWFDAEEALAYGFIDHIVESVRDVRPAMAGV